MPSATVTQRRKKIDLNLFRRLARRHIWKTMDGRVISGPFKGLRYVQASVGSRYEPKLLGTYEKELHPVVEHWCQARFDTILNVGAAEGYYAIGLALRCPQARILAFESEATGQQLLREMAELNGIADRLTIHGACDRDALNQCLPSAGACLLVVDVEGAEMTLLDPQFVPGLRHATLLVEMHDHLFPGSSQTLRDRFQDTHVLEVIWQRPRVTEDLPVRSFWLNPWLKRAMNEKRPKRAEPMSWFSLVPKGRCLDANATR